MSPRTRGRGTKKLLAIDELAVPGVPGLIGLSECPGDALWAGDPLAGLRADLERIADWGAAAMLTLVGSEELRALGIPGLGEEVERHDIAWHHLPIRDHSVPDAAFEAAWRTAGPVLRDRLARGQRILIHCLAGLGRTGTVAARLLIEHGLDPEAAILQVRQSRPGSIETRAQAAYLRALLPP